LGAHFSTSEGAILLWDGSNRPATQEGDAVFITDLPDPDGVPLRAAVPIGPTLDGGQWIVRATGTPSSARILARVRHLPAAGSDMPLTSETSKAFLPTAAIDAQGRLHVAWYRSDGPVGVLELVRSLSSDLTRGFGPPLIIDSEACPGQGWFPYFDSSTGGRR